MPAKHWRTLTRSERSPSRDAALDYPRDRTHPFTSGTRPDQQGRERCPETCFFLQTCPSRLRQEVRLHCHDQLHNMRWLGWRRILLSWSASLGGE